MKKLIALVLLVVMMATMLAACGKFTCDICDEEKSGKQYEGAVLGEEFIACEDCYEKSLEDPFYLAKNIK